MIIYKLFQFSWFGAGVLFSFCLDAKRKRTTHPPLNAPTVRLIFYAALLHPLLFFFLTPLLLNCFTPLLLYSFTPHKYLLLQVLLQ